MRRRRAGQCARQRSRQQHRPRRRQFRQPRGQHGAVQARSARVWIGCPVDLPDQPNGKERPDSDGRLARARPSSAAHPADFSRSTAASIRWRRQASSSSQFLISLIMSIPKLIFRTAPRWGDNTGGPFIIPHL